VNDTAVRVVQARHTSCGKSPLGICPATSTLQLRGRGPGSLSACSGAAGHKGEYLYCTVLDVCFFFFFFFFPLLFPKITIFLAQTPVRLHWGSRTQGGELLRS